MMEEVRTSERSTRLHGATSQERCHLQCVKWFSHWIAVTLGIVLSEVQGCLLQA
jgi:hypothetical protein